MTKDNNYFNFFMAVNKNKIVEYCKIYRLSTLDTKLF